MKKVNFLANNINKQRFIYLLGSYLEKKCKVFHAPGDADVLIVQKTVESSTMMETVQCACWLVMIQISLFYCYHANLDSHNIIKLLF